MDSEPMLDIQVISSDVRKTLSLLRVSQLKESTLWASELLLGSSKLNLDDSTPPIMIEGMYSDRFSLATSYFEQGNYGMAIQLLQSQTTGISFFLLCYSKYMLGEKNAKRDRMEKAQSATDSRIQIEHLSELSETLKPLFQDNKLDPFSAYLLGVVSRKLKEFELAKDALVRSVNQFPVNWSAWIELGNVCKTREEIDKLSLNDHWMKLFFWSKSCLHFHDNEAALEVYAKLHDVLGDAPYILGQLGYAYFNAMSYDESEKYYTLLREKYPFRLVHMDNLSNIYFVHGRKDLLGNLAQTVVRINKFCPESCIVIGNYYSLSGKHEDAIKSFQRAVQLDSECHNALTLAGHEYMELNQPQEAIKCYRKAVDVCPMDFRAWYGLGQTHELQQMYHQSLHYYKKATLLRPTDSRMWCAMGQCYESLNMCEEAKECYQQADDVSNDSLLGLQKLINFHRVRSENSEALDSCERYLEKVTNDGREDITMTESNAGILLFMAQQYHARKEEENAIITARKLLKWTGPESDEARSILRELNDKPWSS
eukprot:TRINITY_DN44809_c0_g1_i1.p1 TRINITY_DN44809_c0_g1~~TRINITY_DN44809_c0_g1_i1.p1  ORF type:complete len:540 (+),score=114.56 TRINITY_DN44809_c0_g1_i1:120-1739(+)